MPIGNFPEIVSQQISAGIILVGRLGVDEVGAAAALHGEDRGQFLCGDSSSAEIFRGLSLWRVSSHLSWNSPLLEK